MPWKQILTDERHCVFRDETGSELLLRSYPQEELTSLGFHLERPASHVRIPFHGWISWMKLQPGQSMTAHHKTKSGPYQTSVMCCANGSWLMTDVADAGPDQNSNISTLIIPVGLQKMLSDELLSRGGLQAPNPVDIPNDRHETLGDLLLEPR